MRISKIANVEEAGGNLFWQTLLTLLKQCLLLKMWVSMSHKDGPLIVHRLFLSFSSPL